MRLDYFSFLLAFPGIDRLTSSSQDTKQKLEALLSGSKEDALKFEALQKHVTQIRQGVVVSSFSLNARAELQQIVCMQEDVFAKVAQERILGALAFKEIHERYEMVDEAHCKTLRWIFNDEYFTETQSEDGSEDNGKTDIHSAEQSHETNKGREFDEVVEAIHEAEEADVAKIHARTVLTDWLSEGEEILHISGKLGSGKSTLIKFLWNHPATDAALRKWAGK